MQELLARFRTPPTTYLSQPTTTSPTSSIHAAPPTMIGKCGYNYMKESLLIMHTRSKIQTSQNLIFRYLGISTNYTPQIKDPAQSCSICLLLCNPTYLVLFHGSRCAPTIRHLACLARCSIETTTPHTDQPPPPPTTTI